MSRSVITGGRSSLALASGLTGLLLIGLLFGFEPVGGDPDRLYRPLKVELARFLALGGLPFWSDRLGLGIPLLAESHCGALYPLNWLLYGLLHVSAAYRLAMWLHYIVLTLTTYAYARFLKISAQGAALAAVGFTFCGFQAIHSSHEPFYQILPYLPLALLLAEWYLNSGRLVALVLLACAWGVQITLGHFQLQAWTAGLVLALGAWRVVVDRLRWTRFPGLVLGLAWGAALAAVQLNASWELTRFLGFTQRSFAELANYAFPPAHWAELVIPGFLRGVPGGPEGLYWLSQGSTGYEACFYVGTIPLFLAVMALGGGRDRHLHPWLLFSLTAILLAMLPRLWPDGFATLIRVPGLGWFRAPGRYTLIASLGLCLVAGHGLDRLTATTPRAFLLGILAVWVLALSAGAWAWHWAAGDRFRSMLGGQRLFLALGAAAVSWLVATGLVIAVRRGRLGSHALTIATALELGILYYTATTVWGAAVALPRQSPILTRLAEEPHVGRVAGVVANVPLWEGASPFLPYTGFAPLPPHPAFEFVKNRNAAATAASLALLRRYGATHGIWDGPVDPRDGEILLEVRDAALDELVIKSPGSPAHPLWRLVRYAGSMPEIRAARGSHLVDEQRLVSEIVRHADSPDVWSRTEDGPAQRLEEPGGAAAVTSWDGTTAVVRHDGPCVLVMNRTFYPGWYASIDGTPAQPVRRAELGIQTVWLPGNGESRIRFMYRPAGLRTAASLSLGALALALLLLLREARVPASSVLRRLRERLNREADLDFKTTASA